SGMRASSERPKIGQPSLATHRQARSVDELGGGGARLRDDSSQRDDVLGVDREVYAGFGLDEPRELHDRAPSRVEDCLFDVLGMSLDAVAPSGDEGYLAGRSHRPRWSFACAHLL